MSDLVSAVGDNRVVLFLGPGGVGKTTVAAAAGVALARQGERVVVLTIDPARRLAEVLGLTPERVAEPDQLRLVRKWGQGSLWATMLDPAATFTELVRSQADTPDQAERILTNPLFANLTRSLSGTSEYMAAERLHQLAALDRFDRIIVDTPPSRHAFDFLDAPSRLVRFVDHRIYRTVFAPRGLTRVLSFGPRVVLSILGQMVGAGLVDDVVRFFADFETMDQGFRRRADELDRLLAADDTGYVVVTTPRRHPLTETGWIAEQLAGRGRCVEAVVINRACPAPSGPGGGSGEITGPLRVNLDDFRRLAEDEARLEGELATGVEGAARVRIPDRARPLRQLEDLINLD